MTTYTDAMIKELNLIPGLNYEKAGEFADKYGISVRSVIAKARSLEIPYAAKAPGTKTAAKGARKISKADFVESIQNKTDLKLASLDKMTLIDLQCLFNYVDVH